MIMMTLFRHYLDSDYIDVLYIGVEFLHLLSISKNRKRMGLYALHENGPICRRIWEMEQYYLTPSLRFDLFVMPFFCTSASCSHTRVNLIQSQILFTVRTPHYEDIVGVGLPG
ncbi:hypothetical protein I7I50_04536 [Histoplasma capsulatum G186AR]|uniref:Uncharacterized protein n=1 Tax=Ajellomyces capsulatus TaxID=5037 RepID=A0A8H8CY26_AJECA|nr:hypothetical protein I7I52_05445 [Histoplasma capsulatum]QSS75409.1 hypothetical protein I7I50_04536 [Histoplasma capsulatum G186AR]